MAMGKDRDQAGRSACGGFECLRRTPAGCVGAHLVPHHNVGATS